MLKYLVICVCVSAVRSADSQNLTEGESCTSYGIRGICTNIDRCLTTYVLWKNKGLKPEKCNDLTDGEHSVVCCTDCRLVDDASKAVVDPNTGILWKTGERAWDACMEYLEELPYKCKSIQKVAYARNYVGVRQCSELLFADPVEGGTNAERGEYPHMALLGYGEHEETLQWLCGGSVISDSFILTAGHCISTDTRVKVSYVALGILKRTDPPSLWQKHKVKNIIRHPKYKPPSKYNDIALLETVAKITFNTNTLPACLAIRNYVENEEADVTGWGALGHKQDLAETLQRVTLHKFDTEECSEHYPKHRHLVHGFDDVTQMCYGVHGEIKDSCEGDSGGPLQVKAQGSKCQFTVIGVTSYGRRCGLAGGSGMYTRVLPYVDWIQDVVWPWV